MGNSAAWVYFFPDALCGRRIRTKCGICLQRGQNTGRHYFSPMASAAPRMPSMVSAIKSTNSILSRAAPFSIIVLSTPAANRLSFHFLVTDLAVRSITLRDGRTNAEVVTRPVSSSMAYKTFSSSDSGSTSVHSPHPWLIAARIYSSGHFCCSQNLTCFFAMLFGESFVIEIVN